MVRVCSGIDKVQVIHQQALALGPFLTFHHGLVDVGDNGMGVCNTVLNIGNNCVGICNVMLDIRNDGMGV